MNLKHSQEEETLDPEDWDCMRVLGHQMIDDLLDYLEDLKNRPVWQHAQSTRNI